MGRHAARSSQKTRIRASRFCFRRGLVAQCEGEEACFRPRLGRGAAKEKKAAAVSGCSLCRRVAPKKKRIKKITMLTPQQHALQRDNPAPPRPPSRSHLRLS